MKTRPAKPRRGNPMKNAIDLICEEIDEDLRPAVQTEGWQTAALLATLIRRVKEMVDEESYEPV